MSLQLGLERASQPNQSGSLLSEVVDSIEIFLGAQHYQTVTTRTSKSITPHVMAQQPSSVCNTPLGHTDDVLCDMSGNLYEWVQDEWHANYSGAPTDGNDGVILNSASRFII